MKVFEGSRGTFFKKSALAGFGTESQGLSLSAEQEPVPKERKESKGGAHQNLCEAPF